MALATPNSREPLTAKASDADETPSPIADDDDGGDDIDDIGDGAATTVLEPGDYVDRYRILEQVGAGGIGVVYAAADEALGRKVAIKLLRPSTRSSGKFERRRARLIREAQALARLSHPNVVPVYEVGMFEDRVFLAMEFIEGLTMRRWLRQARRRWTEILAVYMQAGRGLAAAHAADIVHRDFKPENVLVGHDGRVRVLDFGLATPVPDPIATGRYPTIEEQQLALERTGRIRTDAPRKRSRPPSSPIPLSESAAALITVHGKVMGTPAYMSPEQARGESIDARADQYSFCVALWEALCGERPQGPLSATGRVRSLRRAADHGEVPQWLLRALERGLSVDPADRFPDMDGLLTALERRPKPWRRLLLVGGLPLTAALALLGGLVGPSFAEPCPREATALEGAWDDDVRARAELQLTASERPYARATWDAVERELDRWTERWLDARVEACEATKVRDEQSPALLDLRVACLDRQANALRGVTEGLTTQVAADEVDGRLEAALAAVLALPDPSRCDQAALAGNAAVRDAPLTGPLARLRDDLDRARGLLEVGNPGEAIVQIEGVTLELGAGPLAASDPGVALLATRAELLRGRALAALQRPDAAAEALRAAVFAAQTAGLDELTVSACAALVDLLAAEARLDEADNWAALGRATLARLGGDPQLEAELLLATARLAFEHGAFADALVDQQRVLALREQLHGPEHVEVAQILGEMVTTQERLGRFAEAEIDVTRALAILTHEFGFTHPERGLALTRQASLEHARGREREALSLYLDALAIFELAYGTKHELLAQTLHGVASAHYSLGEYDDALVALRRAREIRVAVHGAEHPSSAEALVGEATVLYELGRDDEALERFAAAEQVLNKTRGPEHPANAFLLFNRAELYVDQRRYDEALAEYRRAHAIWQASVDPNNQVLGLVLGSIAKVEHLRGEVEAALALQREALGHREAALGEGHPKLALHLTWIGRGLVALGRFAEARAPLERALELLEREGGGELELLGDAKLALADVVWHEGQTREREAAARELARAAAAAYEQLGPRLAGPARLDAARSWLREHGG